MVHWLVGASNAKSPVLLVHHEVPPVGECFLWPNSAIPFLPPTVTGSVCGYIVVEECVILPCKKATQPEGKVRTAILIPPSSILVRLEITCSFVCAQANSLRAPLEIRFWMHRHNWVRLLCNFAPKLFTEASTVSVNFSRSSSPNSIKFTNFGRRECVERIGKAVSRFVKRCFIKHAIYAKMYMLRIKRHLSDWYITRFIEVLQWLSG